MTAIVADVPPLCQCGCGGPVAKYHGRWNRFLSGHSQRGRVRTPETGAKISAALRGRVGPLCTAWKGGRRLTSHGYVELWMPSHPRSRGSYVFEHIVVMEQHLGRPITRDEAIHHRDGDKTHNDPSNLELLTHSEHAKRHVRPRNPVILTCPVCGDPFETKESHRHIRTTCGFRCFGLVQREIRRGKPKNHKPTAQEKQEAIQVAHAEWQRLYGSVG